MSLADALEVPGRSKTSLTVLDKGNDPFRVDTPAGHRDARWLVERIEAAGLTGRTLHLRGMHYALLGSSKPDGGQYINDERNWAWLSGQCAKAARWLGYLPWEAVKDQRNAEPVIVEHDPPHPDGYITAGGLHLELPDPDQLLPRVAAVGFEGVQPYRLVIYGEKSSLEPVLAPLAARYRADLYLPTGEISDTLMHRMASTADTDGRPLAVFTFSDSDPSGWQMPISISRKLQAFQQSLFPDLRFLVRRVALQPDDVKRLGLPSTPLKDSERRADGWQAAHGVAQTEIDALATLQPHVLQDMAEAMLSHYFDRTLQARVREAREQWMDAADEQLSRTLTPQSREALRTRAGEQLDQLRDQLHAIEDALRFDPGPIELPPITIPDPVLPPEPESPPVIDSRWTFTEQCDWLKAAKEYRA